jgi:hypothetical protein
MLTLLYEVRNSFRLFVNSYFASLVTRADRQSRDLLLPSPSLFFGKDEPQSNMKAVGAARAGCKPVARTVMLQVTYIQHPVFLASNWTIIIIITRLRWSSCRTAKRDHSFHSGKVGRLGYGRSLPPASLTAVKHAFLKPSCPLLRLPSLVVFYHFRLDQYRSY